MPPDERLPHVIRKRVQEQNSFIYDELLLLHVAGHRPQRLRRARGSGGGVIVVGIVASRPQRALRPCRQPVAASASELYQRPPVAASGSLWAAPVLWVAMQPL